jgi:RND family efflux transporter MFP subunit
MRPRFVKRKSFRFASGLNSILLFVACCSAGCQPHSAKTPTKATPPAKVAHPGDESALNTITLTEQAEQRLGIELAAVEQQEVQRRRTLGGEVVIPPGQTVIVSAPFAGVLSPPEGGEVPKPGSTLAAGQAIFRFAPLLTPERDVLTPADRIRVAQTKADVAVLKIEAQRQIEAAKVQLQAARIAHDRAVQLLADKAGSQRSVDETEAQRKLAEEALRTAEARNQFLAGIELDEDSGQVVPRDIAAPVAGVLKSVESAPGEAVSPGEPLLTLVQLHRLWIRVPIYAGQRRAIDTSAQASVNEYGRPAADARAASYAAAPPSADPQAATVDLYYEIDNADGLLYPGQKLAVTLAEQTTAAALVVPRSAVLYDIHGGTWVYEQTAPQTFVRRRVEVQFIDQERAILAQGPSAGAKIVTQGAAELFGTEFGIGK